MRIVLSEINNLNFNDLLNYYTESYLLEFGERKLNKIVKKVMTSNKISGLISTTRYNLVAPGSSDFLYCLNEIPYFIFSNGQTQGMAALIALLRWHNEVNKTQNLLTNEELQLRAKNIIKESKVTFN